MSSNSWRVETIENIAHYVTDYVANGSFASLAANVTYKSDPDYAVLIRLTDYMNNFKGPFVYVDEKAYRFLRKSMLIGNEIIISNVGANAGKVFRTPELNTRMTLGPNAIVLKTKYVDTFYYYYFLSPVGQENIRTIITGSAQPKFNKTEFRKLRVPVPSLETQGKIAEILSALDDKIELNRQTNATLEAIAQAIFKEWFVDFNYPGATGEMVDSPLGPIPKGWQVGCLKDIVELANETISPGKLPDTLFSHYSIPAFDSGRIPLEELGSSILSNKFIVKRNSVLVSKLNPRFPRIWPIKNVVQTTSICSTEFQVLLPKKYYYHSFVYNLFYQNFMVETMKSMVSGTSSSHQRVDPKFLLKISIILPTDDIVCDYENIVGDYLTFIENNIQEAVNLRTIRDNLLLNLMNGEIEV